MIVGNNNYNKQAKNNNKFKNSTKNKKQIINYYKTLNNNKIYQRKQMKQILRMFN